MNIKQLIISSFLLTIEQKDYLIEHLEEITKEELNKLLEVLNTEKDFTLMLLKKYKNDDKNKTVSQLKWEMIYQNLQRIKALEIEELNKIDEFDIEKELENII